MAKTKKAAAPFNPYDASVKLGAVDHNSGINWSYTTFESKAVCEEFDTLCNANGYRTRNLHSKTQEQGPDLWSVQYHHYND